MGQVEKAPAETVADLENARRESEERGKEIECLHAALDPVRTETASLEELFQYTVDLIPLSFRDPEATCAQARIADRSFRTKNFHETPWVLAQNIVVQGQTIGAVEVHCREETTLAEGGFFSKGKRHFLEIVAARLGELVRRGLAEDTQLRKSAELDVRNRELQQELQGHRSMIVHLREDLEKLPSVVLEVWDKVLLVPIVGEMNSARRAHLLDELLSVISNKRARFVIVDMTGVQVVDTTGPDHLVKLARSVTLLGAACILTGMGPAVASTITSLGVDLSGLKTLQSLEDGLRECLRQMGGVRVAGMLWASIFRM